MITEPARILQSAIRSSLDVTKYSNGYSEKWLEYLRSLATALESTLDEMEHLKGDLHSLMATLSETKPIVREKMGLPCLERLNTFHFFRFDLGSDFILSFSQDSTADNLQVIEMEIEVIETSLENLEMSPSSARKKRLAEFIPSNRIQILNNNWFVLESRSQRRKVQVRAMQTHDSSLAAFVEGDTQLQNRC